MKRIIKLNNAYYIQKRTLFGDWRTWGEDGLWWDRRYSIYHTGYIDKYRAIEIMGGEEYEVIATFNLWDTIKKRIRKWVSA